MNNKVIVVIKRDWRGKPVRIEVSLETPIVDLDRKPIMEVLEAASVVFGGQNVGD